MIKQIKQFLSNRIKDITIWQFKKKLKGEIVSVDSDLEVISLVGHDFVWMYLVSIFSFKKCFNLDCTITVVNDGTLTDDDIFILEINIQNVHIAYQSVNIDKYPTIKKLRKQSVLMKKIVDCVMIADKENIILLDSDIIFLREADKEVKDMLKNNKVVTYCDIKPQPYVTKLPVNYFNSGFLKFKKSMIDYDKLEKFYKKLNVNMKDKQNKQLIEQTGFAYLLGEKAVFFPSNNFDVYHKKRTAMHFVKQYRFINFKYLKHFLGWLKNEI